MPYSPPGSISVESLHPRDGAAQTAAGDDMDGDGQRHDELAALMQTLTQRYNKYVKRLSATPGSAAAALAAHTVSTHHAGRAGAPPTGSTPNDFLNNATPPVTEDDAVQAAAAAHYRVASGAALPPRGMGRGRASPSTVGAASSPTPNASFFAPEDDVMNHNPRNLSGILSTNQTEKTANVSGTLNGAIRKSPGSIVLPQKSTEYWGERELYLAAEDVCKYLNGGVNYRIMCTQYRRALDTLIAMVREDVGLALTVMQSEEATHGTAEEGGVSSRAVAEQLTAVDHLLRELRGLMVEAKLMLKESGIELPASFGSGLMNDAYTVMSANSLSGGPALNARGSVGSDTPVNANGSQPSNRHHNGGVSQGRQPTTAGPSMGRGYAGRPASRDEGGSRIDRQATPSSGPLPADAADYTDANLTSGSGSAVSATGALASLLKPVSQYGGPAQYGGSILRRTSSNGPDAVKGLPTGGGPRRGSVSTLNDPSTVVGTAHPTRASSAGFSLTDEDFTEARTPNASRRSTTDQRRDFLQYSADPANQSASTLPPQRHRHHPQPPRDAATAAALQAVTGASAGVVEVEQTPPPGTVVQPRALPPSQVEVATHSTLATLTDDVPPTPSSLVESMGRDRLQALQLIYGEGYHMSGIDFLLDAMGLVFRNEYDAPGTPGDDPRPAFAAFQRDVVDHVLPVLDTYEAFQARTSEASPLRSAYLSQCLLTRVRPSEAVLNTITNVADRDVQELNLSGAKLGRSGLEAALGVLPRLHRLERLDLSQNEIHDDALAVVARAVRRRPALRYISLSHNPITAKGLPHVLNIARTVPRLEELRLDGCQLTEQERDTVMAEVTKPTLPVMSTLFSLHEAAAKAPVLSNPAGMLRAESAPMESTTDPRGTSPPPHLAKLHGPYVLQQPRATAASVGATAPRSTQYNPLLSRRTPYARQGSGRADHPRTGGDTLRLPQLVSGRPVSLSPPAVATTSGASTNPRARQLRLRGVLGDLANSRSSRSGSLSHPDDVTNVAYHGGGVHRQPSPRRHSSPRRTTGGGSAGTNPTGVSPRRSSGRK